MRRDIYHSAQAIQPALGLTQDDELTAALIIADAADDLRHIRAMMEAFLGLKPHERKK